MAVKLLYNKVEQFADGTGVPYAGAKLFTYVGGSVNTKATTYTESTGTTPNTNPIVLDASGRLPQPVWGTTGTTLKLVLAPSTDTDPPTSPIWTLDGITGINDSSTVVNEWIAGPAPIYVSATQFTLVGDQTSTFAVGRRLKTTVTAGTVYGRITGSAFTTLTTVTVVCEPSQALDSGLSAVSYGVLASTRPSIPWITVAADTISTIASAATLNLDANAKDYAFISGTTGVTAITLAQGKECTLEFQGALLLTNSASLILIGGANRTTAAGDVSFFRGEASGVVREVAAFKANGKAIVNTANTQPTRQTFTAGAGTYTTPANATRLYVRQVGAGAGGAASATGNGAVGGNTTFGTLTANGGAGGISGAGGASLGGTATGGDLNVTGSQGSSGVNPSAAGAYAGGGAGGASVFGGAAGGSGANIPGTAATGYGSGGSGGGSAGVGGTPSGGGGAAGGYLEKWILAPAATYAYTVGAAGAAGTTTGQVGGAGFAGVIIVDEFYD